MLLKCALVCSSLSGMLSVDEGVVFLTILVGVCEGYLYVFALEMDDRIESVACHGVVKQVFQTITTEDATSVIHDGKPRIEVGIVTEHGLDDVVMELIVEKQRVVGFEIDIGTIFIVGGFGDVRGDCSLLVRSLSHVAVTIGAHFEM